MSVWWLSECEPKLNTAAFPEVGSGFLEKLRRERLAVICGSAGAEFKD